MFHPSILASLSRDVIGFVGRQEGRDLCQTCVNTDNLYLTTRTGRGYPHCCLRYSLAPVTQNFLSTSLASVAASLSVRVFARTLHARCINGGDVKSLLGDESAPVAPRFFHRATEEKKRNSGTDLHTWCSLVRLGEILDFEGTYDRFMWRDDTELTGVGTRELSPTEQDSLCCTTFAQLLHLSFMSCVHMYGTPGVCTSVKGRHTRGPFG